MADPTDDPPPEFGLDYAPAPESTAVVSLADEYGLFIGGEFVEPRSGRTFDTINPATEERLATVAEGGILLGDSGINEMLDTTAAMGSSPLYTSPTPREAKLTRSPPFARKHKLTFNNT
mgnify:CR=1 FL=1